jgi:hypothetical protein
VKVGPGVRIAITDAATCAVLSIIVKTERFHVEVEQKAGEITNTVNCPKSLS